ncbi:uncharacterized protein LOC142224905 [Haematobia irritans]|uniref:uncharacterized protein LOC142224905 n=1 Tax=Haematobia irritans TaxID=7368 RepID=UPI003F50D382
MRDIQNCFKSEIKKSTFTLIKNRVPKKWWNKEVDKLYRLKQAAQKTFDLKKDNINASKLHQAIKNFQNAAKRAKKQSFCDKVEKLNNKPDSKSLFKFIRGCKESQETSTSSKWCEENNMEFLNHMKLQVPDNTFVTPRTHFAISHDFSLDELVHVLKGKTTPSAAGLDGITYEMIHQLSLVCKKRLLEALNNSWRSCEISDNLRKIKIVPVPKKGKDLDIYTNFRPIALISVLIKITNLMVKERLNTFINLNHILPNRSYAYRKNMSASHCINDLIHTMNLQKEKGRKVVLVTMDVSNAYERVNISVLQSILLELNFPNQIIAWIMSFLCKRILVMGNNQIEIFNGIPQGSCLSPLLFNIYTLGLHGVEDENTHVFQFADDFIILTHSHDFDDAIKKLQNKVISFASLLKDLNLKINIEKTSTMYVAKGARKVPLISLAGQLIKPVTSIKFLGRNIKNSLSLKEHYDEVINSCSFSLKAIRMITTLNCGIHPYVANNITKSIIFSKTEYLNSSMAHMPTYLNKKITSFQYQILRRNLGLTRTTPTHVIYALAGTLPPKQRTQLIAAKELIKLKTFNLSLYQYITSSSSNTSLGMVYHKFKYIFDNISINDFKTMGYSIWATDASIGAQSSGCAVCNISTNQNFLFSIPHKVSSLTGELHAIDKAIDLILEEGIRNAVIFTDSKNACLLISNNSAHNYLVNNILEKINNSYISTVTFIWTPSHVGITPNETADYYAKYAVSAGCPISTALSIRDAQCKIQESLWNEWSDDYKEAVLHKGTYFKLFFHEPPKTQWFKNVTMAPTDIKTINRLLTGHTYCKKFLHRIGIAPSNLCDTCNVVEDEHHLIFSSFQQLT